MGDSAYQRVRQIWLNSILCATCASDCGMLRDEIHVCLCIEGHLSPEIITWKNPV